MLIPQNVLADLHSFNIRLPQPFVPPPPSPQRYIPSSTMPVVPIVYSVGLGLSGSLSVLCSRNTEFHQPCNLSPIIATFFQIKTPPSLCFLQSKGFFSTLLCSSLSPFNPFSLQSHIPSVLCSLQVESHKCFASLSHTSAITVESVLPSILLCFRLSLSSRVFRHTLSHTNTLSPHACVPLGLRSISWSCGNFTT